MHWESPPEIQVIVAVVPQKKQLLRMIPSVGDANQLDLGCSIVMTSANQLAVVEMVLPLAGVGPPLLVVVVVVVVVADVGEEPVVDVGEVEEDSLNQ